jgi:curved DNA-binding protein CbpA
MGNQISSSIPDVYLKMYGNILKIQSPQTRAQMITTVLSSPEHAAAAKSVGVYGHMMYYVQMVQTKQSLPLLPGEQPSQTLVVRPTAQGATGSSAMIQQRGRASERAMNYFSACLRILELDEEVALTHESLKAAYKKAVMRAHPDKGGSEKEFEAVTKAYAYLGEILSRITGGRKTEGKVEAPEKLKGSRTEDADKWKHVEPVRLNPSKLDMNAFNEMFEKTKIPDPEEDGYGDWLKNATGGESSAPKFSGKFNRDVFNKAFEEDAGTRGRNGNGHSALVVQEMSLANRMGYATELGRGHREDYTVAANDVGLQYTDLKKAYTEYNTFSGQVAGVQIENRSFEQVQASRDRAPDPLRDSEMAALQAAEEQMKKAEEQRKLRVAQEAVAENSYFERMKRLVITNK